MNEKQIHVNHRIQLVSILIVLILTLVSAYAVYHIKAGKEPGWHEKNGEVAYYIDDNGNRVTGHQMIDGKCYFFTNDGELAEKGWIEGKGGNSPLYYCLGSGELAIGWKYIDGKVWYFYQNDDVSEDQMIGTIARNYTTTGGLAIPEEGYIDGDEGLALAYGIDVLDRFGWNLKAAYKYSSSLGFIPGSDVTYGLRIHSCANQGFKYGKGNCLAWSGTFCVMAKLLGYDCRQIWGTLEWKGTRPHSWTEIWEDDGPHVYDPRKHDGEDMAGFDVRYGDKGAYKYNEDSKQYLEW